MPLHAPQNNVNLVVSCWSVAVQVVAEAHLLYDPKQALQACNLLYADNLCLRSSA